MDFDEDFRASRLRRYADRSATLVFGPVVRARWTLAQSREAEQHWSDGSIRPCLAWVTTPTALGREPAEVIVAFGTEKSTTTMQSDHHEDDCYWPWELLEHDAASLVRNEPSTLTALLTPSETTQKERELTVLSPCAWHVLAGSRVSTVELLLGHALGKKDKAPRNARVLQVGAQKLVGVGLAKLDVGPERFARVDLTSLAEASARANAVLKKTSVPRCVFVAPDPMVLSEGERVRARVGG